MSGQGQGTTAVLAGRLGRAARRLLVVSLLWLAAVAPAAAAGDGGADDGGSDEAPDLEMGIQPSSTPSRFACSAGGGLGEGLSALALPAVALLVARRTQKRS